MFHIKVSMFSQTRNLESKIDQFHDKLLEVSMNFKKAVRTFLSERRSDDYRKISKQIKNTEHEADRLRREIEAALYSQNLIPDLRADVLHLVENIDKVINKFDEVTHNFYIERPEIPEKFHAPLLALCDLSSDCAENLAIASRAFFRDLSSVRDYSQKVYLIENESDTSSAHLRSAVFDTDLTLANKLQLNLLIREVADIADIAEDCVDELLIFTIKRDI